MTDHRFINNLLRAAWWASCGLSVGACGSAPASEVAAAGDPIIVVASNAAVPTTAIDGASGTVYFTWFADEEGGPAVYVARLGASDSAAAAPVRVNPTDVTVNAHRQAPAQVAVAPDGSVYVAWSTRELIEGRRFPASDLVVARSTDGGETFSSPVFVNDDAGDEPAGHTFHDLDVGPDGTIYVSWLDSRGDLTDLRVATSRDQARTFTSGVVVARGTCQCCRTALAVDEANVYVAWRHLYGDNLRDIAIARSDDGGRTFSDPTRVHVDGWKIEGCPHSGPSLVIADDGAVALTWYTAATNAVGIKYAVSRDGGATFVVERLLERNLPNAQARLSGSGGVWAVWEDPLETQVLASPIDETKPTFAFPGSSPAIDAASGTHTIVWQNEGAIEALVDRRREQ